MTLAEAVQTLIDAAGRWAENAEEEFPVRINVTFTDEQCNEMDADGYGLAIEVRDVWRAIEVATAHLNTIVEGAPR